MMLLAGLVGCISSKIDSPNLTTRVSDVDAGPSRGDTKQNQHPTEFQGIGEFDQGNDKNQAGDRSCEVEQLGLGFRPFFVDMEPNFYIRIEVADARTIFISLVCTFDSLHYEWGAPTGNCCYK